jgi:hypothetical protein
VEYQLQKRKILKSFLSAFILQTLALNFLGCSYVVRWPYYYLAPFKGKVIDTDAKEPIEGAVVLAVYYMTTISIAGGGSYPFDAQETLTDENGEFRIPTKRVWFHKISGWPPRDLEIFKPGYGTLWHKRAKAVGENKSRPPPKKYVVYELPKLKTIKGRKYNLPRGYHDIPYMKRKLYMKAINEESVSLGLEPYPIPSEGNNK